MGYRLDDTELYYFNEGISTAAYNTFGCHRMEAPEGGMRYRFSVYAPAARAISVVGDFNAWNPNADPMERVGPTGAWEAFIGIAKEGQHYKYHITGPDGNSFDKADPFAFCCEKGGTASEIYTPSVFPWRDKAYFDRQRDPVRLPMSIYEVHPGSWRKDMTLRTLARELVEYVVDMGYTHIELMPIMAYPYDPSWGYQVTGYYSPTARYGTPDDLKFFVDCAHARGIGVIMDWVPAHFTRDAYGLARFDGTPLYEHADPLRSDMPQWGTLLFNFDRTQVQSFLLSSALWWLSEYHMDGLRVDAVSCMLYLDFGREDGRFLPNEFGGNQNGKAVEFFRMLATAVKRMPNRILFAEESSAFPGVTQRPSLGGLGFTFKWNMGWMNDILAYMEMDSFYRKWHHNKLTFSMMYAFSEHFVLPFSHDEVVHGKRSLLSKMPGDYWQKFAQLRLLFAYQYAHPGKKLMFMGCEFGQFIEWRFDEPLDWHLLDYEKHKGVQRTVRELNRFYLAHPQLWELDASWDGFCWASVDDNVHSVIAFLRIDEAGERILCAFNFTPVPHESFRIGMPDGGRLHELFSTDEARFGGTGQYRNPDREIEPVPADDHPNSVCLTLPPFAAVYFELNA